MTLVSRLGPLRLHWEVLLVALAIGLSQRPEHGVGFLLVVALHEAGHGLLSALWPAAGAERGLRLQLGSGAPYLSEVASTARDIVVLVGGAFLGFGLALGFSFFVDLEPGPWSDLYLPLRSYGATWLIYQLSGLPVSDLGVGLRRSLGPRWGHLRVWWAEWALGAAVGGALVASSPTWIEPVAWLGGLAVLLARGESAHIRHLEAFEAMERGQLERCLKLVLGYRGGRAFRGPLAELGVHAALELEHTSAVERLAEDLHPTAPLRLEAVVWLLRRDRDVGALFAERAHDRVDEDRAPQLDLERYADLSFYHAVFEARHLRPESAMGLLERAAKHGFSDRERWSAEGAFDAIRHRPRFLRLLDGDPR